MQFVRKQEDDWRKEKPINIIDLFINNERNLTKEQFNEIHAKSFYTSLKSEAAVFMYFPALRMVFDWIEMHKDDELKPIIENLGELVDNDANKSSTHTKVMKIDSTRYLFVNSEKLMEYCGKMLYLNHRLIKYKYYLKYYELPLQNVFWQVYERGINT